MTTCEHIGFTAHVDVARLTDEDGGPVTGFAASVVVTCAMCQEAFEFIGVPIGLNPRHPTTNASGTELRAPIRPQGSPDGWGEDGPGFGLKLPGTTRHHKTEPGVDLSHPNDHGLLP